MVQSTGRLFFAAKFAVHQVIGRSPMVRFFIAIACVSLLVPSSTAFAQSRTSGTKAPSATGRTQAQTAGKSRVPTTSVAPVSRTQALPDAQAGQPAQPGANDGNAAQMKIEDDILKQQAPEMSPDLVRELDRILQFWSDASDEIQRLEGKHFRIVYDHAFYVEKQSEGEFAYEKRDKGRIDVTPIEITPQLIAAREKEAATALAERKRSQVRVKPDGTPYDLVPEQPERWSCDGQRVYSLDVEKNEAIVAQLPADMQGKNIMDSPLPFLFGMPPEKAKRRFTIFFTGGKFDPKSGRVGLTAYPRLPQDAQTWRQADVILDLKEFLPVAVQLTDPAGTKVTVYKFNELKKNRSALPAFLGGNPKTHFTPDLREFHVQMIGDEKPAEIAENPAQGGGSETAPMDRTPALINVSGLNHNAAVIQLERQGLKRVKGDKDANQIVLEAGPPATRAEDVFTVKSQDPKPGTPLQPGMKVKLTIWTDPKTAQK
jgi:hypothetical protein